MTARTPFAFNTNALVVLLTLLLILSLSCGGNGGPTSPKIGGDDSAPQFTPPNERNARTPDNTGNHAVWGVYTMVIDQEMQTIEVLDNRELALHLNVRDILMSDWWCPAKNCIKIQFLEINGDIYTIKGTLVNPTWFIGYDVRVIIFYDEKGHDLLNADDYTMLYEDEDDINPFRSYAKTVDQREFGSFSSFSEIFELYVPPVPKKFQIDFAVDASWPGNCEEPYEIEKFGYEGSIYPDDPDLDGIDQGEGMIYTEVFDWQDNVSEVSVDTTPITGGITNLDYNTDLARWEALITNSEDTEPGEYRCLIAAFSEDDPSLGLYNYLIVTVDETPPPAVQTIWGHVWDSFFMDDLDGSVLSVVNQDPLGFSPEPVVIENGEYLVDVTTGVFNISVTPSDNVHLSQVCWDIVVTTDEDVKVNFGLNDPTAKDPYDPWGFDEPVNYKSIMGFPGRVVDSMGFPIVGATIELTTPDAWGDPGQDFVQAEISDEGGYFSLLNAPIETDEWMDPITQYNVKVRAEGFIEADLGLFPTTPDEMRYQVIILLSQPVTTPIWSDSFESSTTDWDLTGYYHCQMYDPSILNVSYDPVNLFMVEPPDEEYNTSIPVPSDGAYYLWYGVEVDGNFIGVWNPIQEQYGGGTSISEHSGYATSPEIDLTGYTSARVEFNMCYEIESNIPSGFDMMRFYINDGMMDHLIKFYNTFVDPGPISYPVSLRGYFRTPIWCHYEYDISDYVGGPINLRFHFDTNDGLYNGGRGQFIDNIKVYAQ